MRLRTGGNMKLLLILSLLILTACSVAELTQEQKDQQEINQQLIRNRRQFHHKDI
jgi:outer membrane biogenesis lipoprotein LolB